MVHPDLLLIVVVMRATTPLREGGGFLRHRETLAPLLSSREWGRGIPSSATRVFPAPHPIVRVLGTASYMQNSYKNPSMGDFPSTLQTLQ
ncbi:hypothetical protein B9Q09_04435 [Candidatus Marsarchaeota G2 archaeon ECH_B_SAG-C16]|uniref:Uncharacterized protein n=1 Tax=Candidatus Marsarchaeota G2 archaeon ECH_B_SAG-C16 TaxID=1978163 RepID=A0A2R6B686_9ARCH|nr:MAG: hypothetical protein B9Q09_04435 [Candidatus Marsarchaeota G2 archaeon ECH_B_SAG-C16]